jgi:hypothetical protein
MLKIEEGKFYKTRDGRKVGPIVVHFGREHAGAEGFRNDHWYISTNRYYSEMSGRVSIRGESPDDLIEEWSEKPTPIRTITRREIVPGQYGAVWLETDGRIVINGTHTPEELREAAHVLNQIAEYLESEGK